MKKLARKILIVLALMILICGSVSVEAAKKSVAVLPLENVSGYDTENVADIMTEELIVALLNSNRYMVIERAQIAAILREQGFQNVTVDPSNAVELGKLAGAQYSVIGKVTLATIVPNETNRIADILGGADISRFFDPYKGKVAVDIRFVNNETGALIFAKSFEGCKSGRNYEEAFYAACKEVAKNFLTELRSDLMGRIVDFSGWEVYIDQGIDSGLRNGDTLLIFRETEPIIINDKIVGMKTIPIGKAKVVDVYAEYSICKIERMDEGSRVRKGDIVKRG